MSKQRKKRSWNDLSRNERAGVVGVGVVQIGLLAAALTDIARRPAEQIKGPKAAWAAASFINFAGPIAYFAFGRKR
jgi:Phospholipase_D-nuclease N-terminal